MKKHKIIELVKRARMKEPECFVELMKLFEQDMYRVAVGILSNDQDAADAIQETILTCWEKIQTLRDDKLFKTWMTRILINHCYRILKNRANIEGLGKYEEPSTEDEYNLEWKECISILDEKYRIPIILYYGEGYKTTEIAELLQIPKSTVRTRLARGRERISQFYGFDKE